MDIPKLNEGPLSRELVWIYKGKIALIYHVYPTYLELLLEIDNQVAATGSLLLYGHRSEGVGLSSQGRETLADIKVEKGCVLTPKTEYTCPEYTCNVIWSGTWSLRQPPSLKWVHYENKRATKIYSFELGPEFINKKYGGKMDFKTINSDLLPQLGASQLKGQNSISNQGIGTLWIVKDVVGIYYETTETTIKLCLSLMGTHIECKELTFSDPLCSLEGTCPFVKAKITLTLDFTQKTVSYDAIVCFKEFLGTGEYKCANDIKGIVLHW